METRDVQHGHVCRPVRSSPIPEQTRPETTAATIHKSTCDFWLLVLNGTDLCLCSRVVEFEFWRCNSVCRSKEEKDDEEDGMIKYVWRLGMHSFR